jgi:hypothetical protein
MTLKQSATGRVLLMVKSRSSVPASVAVLQAQRWRGACIRVSPDGHDRG